MMAIFSNPISSAVHWLFNSHLQFPHQSRRDSIYLQSDIKLYRANPNVETPGRR